MRTRKLITTVSAVLLVAVAAIVLVVNMMATDQGGEARASARVSSGIPSQPAASVQVTQPLRRAVTRELSMPGTLLPEAAADLYAKVSGYVATVNVDIGSHVRRGEVLLSIDVPEMADELRRARAVLEARQAGVGALAAKVDQAEAMIETARAEVQRAEAEHELSHLNHERRQTLRQGNAIPQQELDEATSRLAVADAELKITRAKVTSAESRKRALDADVKVAQAEEAVAQATVARLQTLMGYAAIRAPFDGVITDRLVDPGAFVRSAAEGATTSLLRIAQIDRIRLALDIPEPDAPFVRRGTEVDITVKALDGEPIRASVTRTAVALKANTRTMRVEVDIDNADGRLAPGMYAQVVVKLETKQQALVIPSQAVRVRGRELSVLVADGLVAKSVSVTIGYDNGIWAEVIEGLQGHESIILSANSVIAAGSPVRIAPGGSGDSSPG